MGCWYAEALECSWKTQKLELAVSLFSRGRPSSSESCGRALRLQGIFVDADGYVSEGPNMNIACLLEDGTLVVRHRPPCHLPVRPRAHSPCLHGCLMSS